MWALRIASKTLDRVVRYFASSTSKVRPRSESRRSTRSGRNSALTERAPRCPTTLPEENVA